MARERRGTLAEFILWGTITLSTVQPAGASLTRFIQQQRVEETTKASEDQLGTSVAVWENTALIGTPGDDGSRNNSGAVYVFTRDAQAHWREEQKLTSQGEAADALFGTAIGLHENVAVIGARGDNTQGSFAGAVYIFRRDEQGVWNEAQKLLASDGAAGHLFGFSVACSDTTIAIGARGTADGTGFAGAVYLFTENTSGVWVEVQKITAPEGKEGDDFGASVAVVAETIAVGTPGDDERGDRAGAVYLFAQTTSGQWQVTQKLTASDGGGGDEFGDSVALNQQNVFIGGPSARGEKDQDENGEKDRIGAVYVFGYGVSHIGTQWSEVQKLLPSDENNSREFGDSIAVSETTALIGVRGDTEKGSASGAVYVFTLTSDTDNVKPWTEQQKIVARNAASGDEFGVGVALYGDIAVIGAPLDDIFVEGDETTDDDDETFTNVGSAYILVSTGSADSCTVRTDYDANARCQGTVNVSSLAELDDYVANDFGRKDNNGHYQNLDVSTSLKDSVLIIESPCAVNLGSTVTLTGDFVRVDGRDGVIAKNLDADTVCFLSERNGIEIRPAAVIHAEGITVRASESITIDENAAIDVAGAMVLTSTGDGASSNVEMKAGAIVRVGALALTAPRKVALGNGIIATVTDVLELQSSGPESDSAATIGVGTQIQAADLIVRSTGKSVIDKDTDIAVSGNLTVESIGTSSKSQASVKAGAEIVVNGDAAITSGGKLTLDKNTTLTVGRNLKMEAAQCKVQKSATITASTRSGNCQ